MQCCWTGGSIHGAQVEFFQVAQRKQYDMLLFSKVSRMCCNMLVDCRHQSHDLAKGASAQEYGHMEAEHR